MHRRIASLLPLSLTAVAALAGCGPSDGMEDRLAEAVAKAPAAIQGGYRDEFDSHVVGIVHVSNFGIGACSGTLIAPNVVLTAQHCVAQVSGGGGVMCGQTQFYPPYGPDELYITTKPSLTQNPADYHPAREILIPPGGPQFCGQDQAIIIIEAPIDSTEAIPSVPRVDISLVIEEPYYAVGYGAIYDGGPSGTRYRRDDLLTACVASECPQLQVYQQEWIGDTGVCSGDSGGPAFDLDNRVVGVASRGGQQCSNPVYGHVFGWGEWIMEMVRYAAGLQGVDPPPWATGYPTDPAYSYPVGAQCTGPAECPSNACVDGYCTRQCTEAAFCPDGYQCSSDGFCRKIPPPPPNKSNNDEEDGGSSGCATAGNEDPTKPIPWKTAPVTLAALALMLRSRRRSTREPRA